ncbi:ribosomal protein L40E [Dysgonomonas sp. PFB1-18]|uniref:hypothetical protein n=1 Tax=unclassified Dysgonomonas TaxID=2630389 RepID=UPI0024735A35|nr:MULTISPECIES: hypothetical protein [unclassified Dysgonomonas]MDH6309209.1 ribosomal protein L40E [Dysgonomonas sp. PF1-14]MDH6338911.1 ribosomal protein L40E [Dysgonomonas sp. PF1-16]MDH6380458.1 ribosomal protein L40E [Dysgonomonas sp. PFB1-18]MDH6397739.1 ribosomal protein L40E [Dysgonomonas sp. PF1-23]
MDIETARYITTYYYHLFSDEEKLALRHQHSTIKLSDREEDNHIKVTELYKEKGWLSDWQPALDLLKDGEDVFYINVAKRIMAESPHKVFLNYCSKCNGLARTPQAKQCRFCGYDWH